MFLLSITVGMFVPKVRVGGGVGGGGMRMHIGQRSGYSKKKCKLLIITEMAA